MSTQREGDKDTGVEAPGPGPGLGSATVPASQSVVVTVIPADNPEIPGRISISDASPATTIGEIRTRVQQAIPSHPALQRLRLIHAGTLLADDGLTLEQMVGASVLNERKAVTIHLALRPLAGGALPNQAAPHNPSIFGPQQQIPSSIGVQRQSQPPSMIPQQFRHTVRTTFIPNNPMPNSMVPNQTVPNQTMPHSTTSNPAIQNETMPNPTIPTPATTDSGAGVPSANQTAADSARDNPQVTAQRMYEDMIRQQLQLQQNFLRSTAQAGVAGSLPGQVFQQAIPLQDFQRHHNQIHQARVAQAQMQAGALSAQPQAYAPRYPQIYGNNMVQIPLGARAMPQGVNLNWPQSDATSSSSQQRAQPIPGGFVVHRGPHEGGSARISATTINGSSFPPGTFLTPQYPSIYLLSSPRGHEAILLPPPVMVPIQPAPGFMSAQVHQMGIPTTAIFSPTHTQPTGTRPTANQQEVPNQQNQARAPRDIQPRWQDILAAVGPLVGPLWLFSRLSFFAVILTWRRTWLQTFMIYTCATLIFLYQTGLLAPVRPMAEAIWTPIRQHIESLVRDLDADHQQPAQQPSADGADPNPREAATRLLRQRHEQSFLRRVERSLALFLASFVPGVGEAQVAAREAAERRRREVRELLERERREQAERSAEEAEQITSNDQPENEDQKESAAPVAEPIQPTRIVPESSTSGRDIGAAVSEGLNRRSVQPTVEDDSESDSDE